MPTCKSVLPASDTVTPHDETDLAPSRGCTALLAAFAFSAFAYSGQNLAPQAKIDIAQARSIALKAHPGEITDQELERERGGAGLRYSFDIKNGSVTREVGVDARTGRVSRKQGRRSDPE